MQLSKTGRVLTFLMILLLVVAMAGCGKKNVSEESREGTVENSQETDEGVVVEEDESIPADQLIAMGMAIDGFSYEYVLSLPSGEILKHKMWVKEGNMRSEIDNPSGGDPMLSILNTKEGVAYLYQPELKQAFSMPIDQSDIDTTTPQDFLGDADPENLIYLNRDTFDGKECLVYETRYEGGYGKLWISEEYGMPLRVETQAGNEKVVAEFLNFTVGNIDDTLFILPAGTQIVDLKTFIKSN